MKIVAAVFLINKGDSAHCDALSGCGGVETVVCMHNCRPDKDSPANKYYNSNSGFTLIELLAVLAIVALFAALLLPRVNIYTRWKLEAAARNLMSDLRLLRQEAITSGESCKIKFYINTQRYQLLLAENKQLLVNLPEGVYFEGSTTFPGNPPAAGFNNLGHPNRGGGTVILKSEKGDKLYIIVLPATGRVRVSKESPWKK